MNRLVLPALGVTAATLLGPAVLLPFLARSAPRRRAARARFLKDHELLDMTRLGFLAPRVESAASRAFEEQGLGHLEVVFCADRSAGLNASVVVVGTRAFVGLTSSTVILADSDPQALAAILAHEVAHVSLRHQRRGSFQGYVFLVLVGVPSLLASSFFWGAFAALLVADVVLAACVVAFGYFSAWQARRNEFEADARADALGHGPGLRSVFAQPERVRPAVPRGLETHPRHAERLALLD